MFYHLGVYLTSFFSFFNVIHYVSVRIMASFLTSLISTFILGIPFLKISQRVFRIPLRPWSPKNHSTKANMPSMGGLHILIIVLLNSLLWCNLSVRLVWIFLGTIIAFGFIGVLDDWSKITHAKGIRAYKKFIMQFIVGTFTACLLLYHGFHDVSIPFCKWLSPSLGILFVPWATLIIVGTSNATNLTDGLDGLALTSLIPNFITFSIICYLSGHYTIAHYLKIPFSASAEISIIGSTLIGASLGLLWYNTYPAQIFMGDVGSLALGSGIALMALMSKQELLLPISGGLFVIETLSVILQVFSYKLFRKKIFRMAPIHHHFELLGWQESKITVRFGIISLILCVLALMTLKIR